MKFEILLVFSLIFSLTTIAQEDYLIFNVVVDDYNLHTGEVNNSYWIIKTADIDVVKQNYIISPLYLKDHFTNDNLTDCLTDKKIDISTFTVNTNFDFNEKYIQDLIKLEVLLEERVLLQTIKKKWSNNRKAKVKIYVTPVNGRFYSCKADSRMQKRFGIPEKIVIPESNFELLDFQFLEQDEISEFLYFADFSKYTFPNRFW